MAIAGSSADRARPDVGEHSRLAHPALLYASRDEFIGTMVPYVREGLETDAFVFVAAQKDNVDALAEALGSDASSVGLADTERWHPHTGTRLRAFHEIAKRELANGRAAIRLAGEPVWSGSPELILEWQRYESVLNAVLAPFPATLLCLYDSSVLPDGVLESARRNHPLLYERGSVAESTDFRAPEESLRLWMHDLPPPPSTAAIMLGTLDVPTGRRFVREHAIRAGANDDEAADLAVATSEILSNAFIHGGGPTALWLWRADGRFVCQVDDIGPGLADVLAGYRPPTEAIDGRGLWIVRQLVELLQISSGVGGTSVRIHMRLLRSKVA